MCRRKERGNSEVSLLTVGSVGHFAGDVVPGDFPVSCRRDDGLADHGYVHEDADVLGGWL